MVVTTGFFDGVHLGHRQILSRLVAEASARGEESLVVTFWPHPRAVLQQDARGLRLLSTLEEKKVLILDAGVDRVEVLPFTREFAALTAEEYLRMLREKFGASLVVMGYDNRLGSDHRTAGELPGVVSAGEPVLLSPSVGAISSTKIRSALAGGDVSLAASMLGRLYALKGVVVEGNRLGRTIGFPTANMKIYEPLMQIPAGGVYSVEVETLGRTFRGMCNIGTRPTVSSGNALSVETNIFDFDEDIYGLDITVRFIRRIRDERRFDSLTSLSAQLSADRLACR